MSDQPDIAFLGTGLMGQGMVRRLLSGGLTVRVWNRTLAKAAPLAEDGATVAASPAEAVAGAGVVITMLSDADAVLAAMSDGGAFAAMTPGAIWVQMSTVGIEWTDRLAHCPDSFSSEYSPTTRNRATTAANDSSTPFLRRASSMACRRVCCNNRNRNPTVCLGSTTKLALGFLGIAP